MNAPDARSPGPAGLRGRCGRVYTLITPENQYVSRLPSLPGVHVVKLVTPRLASARFAQYLLRGGEEECACELEPGYEHFLFGLTGAAEVGDGELRFGLADEGFAYIPERGRFVLRLPPDGALLWIKRRYEAWPGIDRPVPRGGQARAVTATPTVVPGLLRRELLDPFDTAFDFNMSLMAFDPGVALHQIEIHDEEHGLYMTTGGGRYQLDADEQPVTGGDFIYMAPYCPQGFVAGEDGAEYLLYKDVYRDGF
jgi:(S)-ureidoglycine aminohydrolase